MESRNKNHILIKVKCRVLKFTKGLFVIRTVVLCYFFDICDQYTLANPHTQIYACTTLQIHPKNHSSICETYSPKLCIAIRLIFDFTGFLIKKIAELFLAAALVIRKLNYAAFFGSYKKVI